MTDIAELVLKANTRGLADAEDDLDSLARSAARSATELGSSMKRAGLGLTVGLTAPLIAFAKSAVDGALAQRQAVAQVDSAIASMGATAGRTTDQLVKTADALELRSMFDADQILTKVTANLLTFGSVSGEAFDRAQQSAIDMTARLGGDLQGATIMLGKALNDPIKGIAALGRTGVQFTDTQKATIESMVELNNVAGAQAVILSEVEKQFGGAAQAAADTDPFRQAKVIFEQIADTVGEALLPHLEALGKGLESIFKRFQGLSPEMQTTALAIGAVAAALGPMLVLVGLSIQALAPFIGVMSAIGASGGIMVAAKAAIIGLGAALGPILLPLAALAAAGALIYANWDTIAPVLQNLWTFMQETLGPPLQNLIEALTVAFSALWDGPLKEGIATASAALKSFWEVVGPIFQVLLVGAIKGAVTIIAGAFDVLAGAIRFITALFDGTLYRGIVSAVRATYQGVKTWLQDKLGAVFDWLGKKIETVTGFFESMYTAVVGNSYVPDMVVGIAAEFAKLQSLMVDPALKATTGVTEATRQMAGDVTALLDRLFPEFAKARQMSEELALLDRAGLSEDLRKNARIRLLTGGEKATVSFEGAPNDAAEGIKVATDEMIGDMGRLRSASKVQTVQVAENFRDMAERTMASLTNLTNSIRGGGFLNILQSVIGLGLQLGSVGAFGKVVQTNINKPLIPRANGGMVSAGQSYMVGEHRPERFTPRSAGYITARPDVGNTHVTVGIDPRNGNITAFVGGQIAMMAPGIAQSGAEMAGSKSSRMQSRRVR